MPVVASLGYEPGHLGAREKKLNVVGKGIFIYNYNIYI
jgi:hypothetical protein